MRQTRAVARIAFEPGSDQQHAVAREPHGLWGRAFRPFFLALALYAVLMVPFWVFAWLGTTPSPSWGTPMAWHGHEMIFGFAVAAIAGFILTAAPVWTGRDALSGGALRSLVVLWVAGRLAFLAAGWLPLWLVAAIDLAFLPVVAGVLLRTLWGSGQIRNYAVLGLLVVLFGANVSTHASVLGWFASPVHLGLRFSVDLIIVLVIVISERITPPFTANALRAAGLEAPVTRRPWAAYCAIAMALALSLSGLFLGRGVWTGGFALLGAVACVVRQSGWQSLRTLHDPLLWSLHLACAWIPIGWLLVAASDLGLPVPMTSGLHALTAGAIGAAILAVVTRVGLGHTGRPLRLPRGAVACYALLNLAAAARVLAPLFGGEAYRGLLIVGGLAWAAAFGLFAILYWTILTTPRPDGRPG